MEELNNKLNTGNPVIISQVISRLIGNIKNKLPKDTLETPEFTFLKEKCISNNPAVSIVASQAILNIANDENSNLAKNIITDLISMITTTKCSCANIAFLINNLLIIEAEYELKANKEYNCPFNLQLPQHPLIVILEEDPKCWFSVFKEISYTFSKYNNNSPNLLIYDKLYKPLFLHTLCNPHESSLTSFKQKLWTFIINAENSNRNSLISCLLSWMQFERRDIIHAHSECRNNMLYNIDFLIELSNLNSTKTIFDENLLLLWQASAVYQLILTTSDPRDAILSMINSLDAHEYDILNAVILILAKSILACPSVYLLDLLKLYKLIIIRASCDTITVQIIKYTLLQWSASSTTLTSDAVEAAKEIFLSLEVCKNPPRRCGDFFKNHETLINTNGDVYVAVRLCISIEKWKCHKDVLDWITELEKAPTFFVVKVVDLLFGLFLCEFEDSSVTFKVFELILKCTDCNRMLALNALTAVLYKLTKVREPELHFRLLSALPKMAVVRDNVQKIVGVIRALEKGAGALKTFSAKLMLDLWKVDSKCYPYLEKFLVAPRSSDCNKWEFYVNRANILKELCALKPELYGKEMVAHLSKILNECNDADGALPCALAVEGITLLCKYEIIDAVTTWAALAPMFENERRIPAIRSLCSFFAEIPNLPYSEAYPSLTEEAVAKLWQFTVYNRDDKVWQAALDALTNYSVEEMAAQMPDEYCDDETLSVKKSGHSIPGQCWVHFLKHCDRSRLAVVGDFLAKMASIEISNYLKFVYQVKGNREPVDYSYLPANSVVRGISTYLKSKMLKWKGSRNKEVYLECLRIFSREYSKPLPPLDWCFLQELVHEEEAKDFCINIASHQVILSGTARRFMVNYIEALIENHTNENDVLSIYRNLKHLAKSVQPFTLKPFLEVTIYDAVELFKNDKKEFLRNILICVKDMLRDQTIQESNKIIIAQIITDIFNQVDVSSKLFEELLECVVLFPLQNVNELSIPTSNKEDTEWLKKAVKIRCHLAQNSKKSPLNWLNEILNFGSLHANLHKFIFEEFACIFQKHKDNTESVLWILELVGQIQADIAEKVEESKILFLCNIFILATLVYSGHVVFLKDYSNCEKMYKLFPRAIATLLEINHWSICTNQVKKKTSPPGIEPSTSNKFNTPEVLEWIYHMYSNKEKIFRQEHKFMFVQCLQALRNDEEFHKYTKWTKYINAEVL